MPVKPSLAGLLMTPLKEIQEEPSGADMTSTSINGGKKKKKKKKKKRMGDTSTMQAEYTMMYYDDEGGNGVVDMKSQKSTPKSQQ